MAAKHVTIRLYEGWNRRAELETHIDDRDAKVLRARFEDAIHDAHGSLKGTTIERWKMVVHTYGGGRELATVRIDDKGNTVVKR